MKLKLILPLALLLFSFNCSYAQWEKVFEDSKAAVVGLTAINSNVYAIHGDDLLISKDNGSNWDRISAPFSFSTYRNMLYANSTLYVLNTYAGIYKSTDGGYNWDSTGTWPYNVSTGEQEATNLFEKDGILYVNSTGGGVVISKDWGNTWQISNKGIPNVSLGSGVIFSAFYNKNNQLICAADNQEFTTKDSGKSWINISKSDFSKEIIFRNNEEDYIGLEDSTQTRLFHFGNKNQNFDINYSNFEHQKYGTIQNGIIYQIKEHNGVEYSKDSGLTWISLNDGFDVGGWNQFADIITSNNQYVFCTVPNGRIYRRPLIGVKSSFKSGNSKLAVQVNANPINEQSTLNLNRELSKGSFEIYNQYGRRVKRIENISGTQIKLNALDEAGFFYFQVLEGNKVIYKGKLLKQ